MKKILLSLLSLACISPFLFADLKGTGKSIGDKIYDTSIVEVNESQLQVLIDVLVK